MTDSTPTEIARLVSSHVHCRLPGMSDATDVAVLSARMRRLPKADRLAVVAASDKVFESYDPISGMFGGGFGNLESLIAEAAAS